MATSGKLWRKCHILFQAFSKPASILCNFLPAPIPNFQKLKAWIQKCWLPELGWHAATKKGGLEYSSQWEKLLYHYWYHFEWLEELFWRTQGLRISAVLTHTCTHWNSICRYQSSCKQIGKVSFYITFLAVGWHLFWLLS